MPAATKSAKKTIKKSEPKGQYFYGVGRRKTSTVRSKYYPGVESVNILVDGKPGSEYFPVHFFKTITTFLESAGVKEGTVELFARGGGVSGQADAARLAIAHSLVKFNEGLKPVIRAFGFLTTDVRNVLPKKAGLKKARKREQWSKR